MPQDDTATLGEKVAEYLAARDAYEQAALDAFEAEVRERFPTATQAVVLVTLDPSHTDHFVRLYDAEHAPIDTGDWPEVIDGEDHSSWWHTVSEGLCPTGDTVTLWFDDHE